MRDRAAALAGALRRVRRFDALRAAGRVELALPGGSTAVLDRGVLRAAWSAGELPGLRGPIGRGLVAEPPPPPPAGAPLPAEAADELVAVASFLDRYALAAAPRRGRGRVGDTTPLAPGVPRRQPRVVLGERVSPPRDRRSTWLRGHGG